MIWKNRYWAALAVCIDSGKRSDAIFRRLAGCRYLKKRKLVILSDTTNRSVKFRRNWRQISINDSVPANRGKIFRGESQTVIVISPNKRSKHVMPSTFNWNRPKAIAWVYCVAVQRNHTKTCDLLCFISQVIYFVSKISVSMDDRSYEAGVAGGFVLWM